MMVTSVLVLCLLGASMCLEPCSGACMRRSYAHVLANSRTASLPQPLRHLYSLRASASKPTQTTVARHRLEYHDRCPQLRPRVLAEVKLSAVCPGSDLILPCPHPRLRLCHTLRLSRAKAVSGYATCGRASASVWDSTAIRWRTLVRTPRQVRTSQETCVLARSCLQRWPEHSISV